MSSTTTPAELKVPREFLPTFVSAATVRVMGGAGSIGGSFSGDGLSLDFSDENRQRDDEKIIAMLELIAEREAVLRALDDDEPVPVALLQRWINEALVDLRDTLHSLTEGEDVDAAKVAARAALLRDLTAWCAANGIEMREAASS